ncbi:beta-N-acetylhexosaminidase [Pseudohalioglobus sediminis]|uniref:beta-N-acetylhexosaminidase n=1 Tax=Pseudohalioglobus sediminis TaxID=2606449 RepID=A0A5B0WNA0_9GAMM|nr:beta-N-acetylhexosaminidase [Pseudohalioglobus sediminis]
MTTLSFVQYEAMTTLSTNSSRATRGLGLELNQVQTDGCSELWLTLHNSTSRTLRNWVLHCDLLREIEPGQDTRILGRVGSHIRVTSSRHQDLTAGGSVTLCLLGAADLLQRHTDLPAGVFLVTGAETLPVTLACPQFPPRRQRTSTTPAVSPAAPSAVSPAGALVPPPARSSSLPGHCDWPASVTFAAVSAAAPAVAWLQHMLGQAWTPADSEDATLVFTLVDDFAQEQYRLQVMPGGVTVTASHAEGFLRAAASLLQLLDMRPPGRGDLSCQQIDDEPRHAYRGLMLDCARHFHSVDTLLELLDWMALYKLNYFHWHLTDDEAWRLEIKAFPQLTEAGAWRGHAEVLPPQLGSGAQRYGGYYSREDVTRVVNAAAARGICVIPEIDIPGHCRAAIASLPQLLCEPADISAYTSVQFFNDNVLNPGLPGTYAFLDAVLDEVCALFPGPYVHMGGDEVPAGAWTGSPACARLMASEGYSNTRDLQGHIMRVAQERLAARGRTLIGWEEVIESGSLDARTPVCAWTGAAAVSRIAASGHPVIGCPAPWAYLDMAWSADADEPGLYWAGTADLEQCFQHFSAQGELHAPLFGVQGNLWCELIDDREKLCYMLFPRLFAIAEWGWCGATGQDWPAFLQRSQQQHQLLAARGVHGRAVNA